MKSIHPTLEVLVVLAALALVGPRPASAEDCSTTYRTCFDAGIGYTKDLEDIVRLKKSCYGLYLGCVANEIIAR